MRAPKNRSRRPDLTERIAPGRETQRRPCLLFEVRGANTIGRTAFFENQTRGRVSRHDVAVLDIGAISSLDDGRRDCRSRRGRRAPALRCCRRKLNWEVSGRENQGSHLEGSKERCGRVSPKSVNSKTTRKCGSPKHAPTYENPRTIQKRLAPPERCSRR